MRGDNSVLALTTTVDEITGEVKPLFAFPVQICKATDAGADVKFDNAAPSGAPYEIRYFDPATDEEFPYAERLKGVRIGDAFKVIDDDAIKAVEEATKTATMVVTGKAPLADVLAGYGNRVCGVYFLQVPTKGGSATAYRLVYEALREVKKGKKVVSPATALTVKRTKRTRQALNFIYADETLGCLVMVEVNFAASMREPDAQVLAPQQATVTDEQIELARNVIAQKIGDGIAVLDAEVDEAVPMKRDLIEKALAGETIEAPAVIGAAAPAEDPTAALMASLAA